ncbi:ABC transporter permease [Actinotalea ferrariae]|uniref:ABC transporter permease n=1 Tax=Actinotalea ferrariae TaxID=1386098 RepID=UPI001C8C788F|nr:ABC transporter permease [Actinotalea ferrariae]MBX9245882.1 ABC transporter permease [Actinotalea ferrariae]
MTIPGSIGTGPVVDRHGKPLRALNQFDARAEEPVAVQDDAPPAEVLVTEHGTAAVERPRPGSRASGRVRRIGLSLVVPVLLLVAWHVATEVTGTFASYELPSPGSVVAAGVELATRENGPTFFTHIQISVQRVLIGFVIGSVTGLAVGALVGLSRLADGLLAGTVGAVRAVPSLGWVPLLVLWIGINEDSKVLLVAIGAFFPVYTTVASALRHVDPHLVEAGRAYGLRGTSLLLRVQLPAATPAVVSGLRLALAQSWLFLVAAELIASSMGLGFLLTDSANNGRVDRILLSLVTLAVLGKVTDALIGVVEKRLLRRW